VDTGPDLRAQLLASRINTIDAILYTHAHADHTHGFDDVRYLNIVQNKPIDIYGNEKTLKEIERRFAYAFLPREEGTFYRPAVVPKEIATATFQVGALTVLPFVQEHGYSNSLGFRFGKFAYSTDVRMLDETAFAVLQGVEVWIVDALREEPHPVHSHVAQSLAWIERLKPRQAYLTHMNQTMDYQTQQAKMPQGVELAYDGLKIIL
jgi:phosphoribosyl 1,2-cyclic phosphate phosphodiesterase